MSTPAAGSFPLGHGDRPPQDHVAAVAGRLLDLAGQIEHWQHTLTSTSSEVEALTEMLAAAPSPGTADSRPGPAATAVGAGQVRALVTRLAASTGLVTWLSIHSGQQPHSTRPGACAPVTGPLLARAEPVRVLVCAPSTSPARALADTKPGAGPDWLRVMRSGAALHSTCGDLLVATRANSIALVPGPYGLPCADEIRGVAINRLMRALVDSLWDGALPLASAERIEEVARQPVNLEILGLLEAGAKDEAIARALGLSLRTCRRHIAELLSAASAGSRFQAASRFTRAGVLSAARDPGAGAAEISRVLHLDRGTRISLT